MAQSHTKSIGRARTLPLQARPQRPGRIRRPDASQGEDRGLRARQVVGLPSEVRQRGHRRVPAACEFFDGPPSNCGPRIDDSLNQIVHPGLRPLQFNTPRIGDFRRRFPPHAVNRAQQIRFGKLRAGTTEFIPAARVHHQQAAVGVLQHVGRVKILAVGHEEIAVGAGVGCAAGTQNVAGDLVQVEGGGEEIVAVIGAEDGAFVAAKTAFGSGAGFVKRVKQVRTGALHAPVFEYVMRFAEHPAINGVGDPVAEAGLAEIDERAGEDGFPFGRECDFDRVVHAAGHDDVEVRAVGPRAIDMRRAVVELATIAQSMGLLGKRAFGPIKIAVRAEIRAVDVIGATGQRATFEPFFPLVRHAVSVRVGELPDARRPGDVNRTFIPEAALREHHLVRVFDRFVESSVAIAVFETDDAMRWVGQLLVRFLVRAGRIRDIEPALVVEAGADGSIHQRRPGDQFHFEAVRHGEGLGREFEFTRVSERNNQEDRERRSRGERLHAPFIP